MDTVPRTKSNDVYGNASLAVQQIYRDLLCREATPSEVSAGVAQINAGATSGAIASALTDSLTAEFHGVTGPIVRLYYSYFLRIPDTPGLKFWLQQLRLGNWNLIGISNFFAISAEFQQRYGSLDNIQFVNLIYQNILGRPADAGGLAIWVAELDSGRRSRGQVMLDFSESPENKANTKVRAKVIALYALFLGRDVGQAELDSWLAELASGAATVSRIGDLLVADTVFGNRFYDACVVSANLFTAPETLATQVSWNGCGTSGVGIQNAFEHVRARHFGTVRLTGPGAVVIERPLQLYSGLTLSGDPTNGQYGTRVIGVGLAADCISAGTYRHPNCRVIEVSAQQGSASTTISALDIIGNDTTRKITLALFISASRNVRIQNVRLIGASMGGVSIFRSQDVVMDKLALEMHRSGDARPEGGAGVWITQSNYVTLQYSSISGVQYYNAGSPQGDHNANNTSAPTMDLVAVYGGSRNRIQHNSISYGNTAGIYVAACEVTGTCDPVGKILARPLDVVVWNNDVSHFQQHGIDIANADRLVCVTNRVVNAGYAGIAVADSNDGQYRFNTLSESNRRPWIPGYQLGTLWFGRGSARNAVQQNDIYGTGTNFAVYFNARFPWDTVEYPNDPTANVITGNKLWSGTSGHFGGAINGNTIAPNTLF